MNLWALAWRNLRHHWARTLTTGAGIILAIASFVSLVGLARGLEDTLRTALEVRGTDIVVTEAGAIDLMSSIVSTDLVAEFANRPGVAAVAPELTRMTSMNGKGSILVVSWPVDAYPWQGFDLVAGALPMPDDHNAAVVGSGFVERHGLSVGDDLELFQTKFRIIGIVDSISVLTRNLVFVPMPDAQRLTFREGKATSLNLRLKKGLTSSEEKTAIQALRKTWPNLTIEASESLVRGYVLSRIANVLSVAISIVALISATLIIFNTITMSVNERRGELAIMNAVGWSRQQTILAILLEGVLLALVSGAIGAAMGFGAAHAIAMVPAVQGYIAPEVSSDLLAGAVLLSVAIGVIGSLLPAIRATARSPAAVLRGR